MNDVLIEMQEMTLDVAGPEVYAETKPDPQAEEVALLRHLALAGELANRRDMLLAELRKIEQALAATRERTPALVQAVEQAGGKLPSWDLG